MVTINYDPADFFGFRNVPFHDHLGLTFERDEAGAAIVALPRPDADDLPPAAGYTVAEVSAALAACDALATLAPSIDDGMRPIFLARRSSYRPLGPLRGRIESRTHFASDAAAVIQRLLAVRKATVEIEVRILTGAGTHAGEGRFDFYIRLMAESQLRAMTAAMETQTQGAR